MARRPTEDFVRHYDLLVSRTGNSPNGIRAALNRDDHLAESIRELDNIWWIVERHRRFSQRRFIVQAHPRFRRAFDAYTARWHDHAMVAVLDWEAEQRGDEPPSQWIDHLLREEFGILENPPASVNQDQHERYEREFDPDEHVAAVEFGFIENILRRESENGYYEEPYEAACSLAAGAIKWIRETVGLNIAEIQMRWKEFPVIVVPKIVSDKHGIEDSYSLFGYLTQVRLAYIIGADLAAIAMCRAATEILLRVHYNKDENTDLMTLIKSTQKRRDGSVLRDHNITAKVLAANDILHVNKDDIVHRDRSRALIRDWVNGLQDMIVKLGES